MDASSSETELVVSLLENHSDFNLQNEFTVWNRGGSVTVEEYIDARPEQSLKMGLQEIPENERSKQYIEFDADYYYQKLKVGDRILVALDTNADGSFFTTIGGYSIFEEVENTSALTDFKNVVSEEIVFI